MDIREFFNSLADKWDEMCRHDDDKLKKIIEFASVKEGSKILDVGTGTGILISYLLEKSPKKITAVDIADNMIAVAKSKYKDKHVEFVAEDIMKYNEQGYDYIFLYSVYPHFSDKETLFYHLSELMNVGGKLIIAHSESKEKINEVHKGSKHVCNDMLPSGEETANVMSKYLKISTVIDSDEMYYVSGVKE